MNKENAVNIAFFTIQNLQCIYCKGFYILVHSPLDLSVILNGEMRVVCSPKGITPFGFSFYAGSSAISLASSATASAL